MDRSQEKCRARASPRSDTPEAGNMKFGIREIIFVVVMLGLLGSTNYFVFSTANTKKEATLAEIRTKQTALSNLQQATAGIDDHRSSAAQTTSVAITGTVERSSWSERSRAVHRAVPRPSPRASPVPAARHAATP